MGEALVMEHVTIMITKLANIRIVRIEVANHVGQGMVSDKLCLTDEL
jgi:hypothetical protein